MMENGRGLIKALENWAKKITAGYRDVDVRDLSSSFRDGLAFCAIINYYRPDLIDFDSLSKENIFENNSLAFKVAEKQLGVPALLDAEDMVKYVKPDRLSIITYLSQLRNCFENQNKVNTKRLDLKRIQANSFGPPAKVALSVSTKRHEVCQVCKHRVFILERLIVDGKLYHTTCFRCNKCNSLLNPGAYVESDIPGLYECSVCLLDETIESTESSMEVPEQLNSHDSEVCEEVIHGKPELGLEKEFASKEAMKFARSNLAQDISDFELKLPEKSLNSFKNSADNLEIKSVMKSSSETGVSVKDKINAFEKNQAFESTSLNSSPVSLFTESTVPSSSNKTLSSNDTSKFSTRQSLMSTKSPNKSDSNRDKEGRNVARISLIKTQASFEEHSSVDGKNVAERLLKSTEIKLSEKMSENINHDKTLSSRVPNLDLGISLSSKNSNFNSKNSASKMDSESPKLSRDIFKASLQPLKLSLTTSNRKDSPSFTRTSSESEKVFDIPQIKSNYATLPQQRIDTKLKRFSSEIKTSSSETNLSNEFNKQDTSIAVRRSSLESNQNNSDKNISNAETAAKPCSKTFERTRSVHEVTARFQIDGIKSLKSYTPIYNNSVTISNPIGTNVTSRTTADSLLQSPESNSISKLCTDNEKNKVIAAEKYNNLDSENNDVQSKLISSVKASSPKTRCIKVSSPKTEDTLKDSDIAPSKINVQPSKEDYPDDLNPFGDEEDDKNEEYPDDLNPFGDDEEEDMNTKVSIVDDYDDSKNPFASDDDDQTQSSLSIDSYSQKPTLLENKTIHDSIHSNLSSPSDSLKGTLKKRKAPKPPLSDIFPKDSGDSGLDISFNSAKSSPSISKKNFQTSSPKIRKGKPAPPPPSTKPPLQDSAADVKLTKENDNRKLKSSMQHVENKQSPKQYKKKKRPAPPVPIPVRRDAKKIPLKEIVQEMREIEEKQREYESQGREIELLIRDRDKDEEPSVEEEEYIMQLFELVNQKNALFRRQAELMYIKRSQRLEEQQYEIEKQIRLLMEKPEKEKTDEDRSKEEELTMELIDIVDQRNSIIDSIEMDRRRELEEDHSVKEQLEIKNGDLPLTAEIKQKSKGKKDKSKEKKEKKKKEQEESGKGTLKKKKLFKRT